MSCCGDSKRGKGLRSQVACVELTATRRSAAVSFLFSLFLWLVVSPAVTQEVPSPKNVLVLYGFTDRNSFIELEPLKASLRAHLSMPVNFNMEYLEATRFNDEGYRRSLSEALGRAHSKPKTDLIVVEPYQALRFVLDYREDVFAGIPIVFIGINPIRFEGQRIWPSVTGITSGVDIRGSLNLSLRFHPDTQNIVLLSGVSEFESYWNDRFREEVQLHHQNLKLTEVIGLPPRTALDRVSALPAHTVVFAQIAPQDSADSGLNVFDLIAAVGPRFPTYSIFNYRFNHGCVGGSYPDQVEDGKRAGEIAARVLSGEKPEDIPVGAVGAMRPMLDWRQLKHWKIPESVLPPGTVVLYRPEPFWKRYRWWPEVAIVLLLGLIFLSLSLLFERARRRRTEAVVARQRDFETLTSQISCQLVNVPPGQMGKEIQKSLSSVREFLGVDRVSIFKVDGPRTRLYLHHSERVETVSAPPEVLSRARFPWLFEQLEKAGPAVISAFDEGSSKAKAELASFREINLRAVLIFPLRVENSLVGMLSFAKIQASKVWPEDLLPQINALSQVYANAFARELAHEALTESESRFRVIGEAAPVFIWMSNEEGKLIYVNNRTLEFTGKQAELLNGNGWFSCLHPDDLPGAVEARAQALEQRARFTMEYRVRRQDGVYRWMLDIGNPRYNSEGVFVGFVGSALDVTDQHLAQDALEKVSGRLIAAQERERAIIARELHDDICQRLFMLALRIENVAKGCTNGNRSMGEQLEQIWQQCSDLTGDVQALSHGLHPSVLDHLGLAAAVRSFCREFSEESATIVEFKDKDLPHSLPREVSLSLFRVIQEALHNAAKYSGQKHFEVRLYGKPGVIELEVSDQGVGFELAGTKGRECLGLVSMAERIHLLNGTITIDSQRNMGTRIRACVPLRAPTGNWSRKREEHMARVRILLADDHTLVCNMLRDLLEPEYEVVGCVHDGRELLKVANSSHPDVVLVDIGMPSLNGLDAGRRLKEANPKIKLIYLTMNNDVEMARDALRVGASAFILKNTTSSGLLHAIRDALRGVSYVAPEIRRAMSEIFVRDPNAVDRPQHLTDRQREVLQMLAEGRSLREIARLLQISYNTVRFHKIRMKEALGISTNAEIVKYALKHGIISSA